MWPQAADKEGRVQRWHREAENRDCRVVFQGGELQKKHRRCGRFGLGRSKGTGKEGWDSAEGSWCEKGVERMGRVLRMRQGGKGSSGTVGVGKMEDDWSARGKGEGPPEPRELPILFCHLSATGQMLQRAKEHTMSPSCQPCWAQALLLHVFSWPPKPPQLGKLLAQGNSRGKGVCMWQQVRRTELGSTEEKLFYTCEPQPPSLSHLETLPPLPPSGQELSHMSVHCRILSSFKDHRLSCFICQQPDCLG